MRRYKSRTGRGRPVRENHCSSATLATAAVARLVLRLVDLQGAAAHVLAIETLNRARRIRARHLDEAEAARLARVAIRDQGDGIDRAVLCKQRGTAASSAEKGRLPT